MALDELGRGTATTDGAAIAAAVVDAFTQKVKCRCGSSSMTDPQVGQPHQTGQVDSDCPASWHSRYDKCQLVRLALVQCVPASCRGLFATHYHKLADAHADDPTTSIMHMACHVADDGAGREQVTAAATLYKAALAVHVMSDVMKTIMTSSRDDSPCRGDHVEQ